ncbi:MAG: AMP-binding protein, partial [Mycobacterium sp.]
MSISLLLEMAVSHDPDRLAVVSGDLRLTTRQLSDLANGGANVIAESDAEHVVYVGTGGAMLPLLIFSSARAGRAFTPINYRLSADAIRALIRRLSEPLVVVDPRYREMLAATGTQVVASDDFFAAARRVGPAEHAPEFPDPDTAAIVLFTSGTTAAPKAVELSHNNLTS